LPIANAGGGPDATMAMPAGCTHGGTGSFGVAVEFLPEDIERRAGQVVVAVVVGVVGVVVAYAVRLVQCHAR